MDINPDTFGPLAPHAIALSWAALLLPHAARISRAARAQRKARR